MIFTDVFIEHSHIALGKDFYVSKITTEGSMPLLLVAFEFQ